MLRISGSGSGELYYTVLTLSTLSSVFVYFVCFLETVSVTWSQPYLYRLYFWFFIPAQKFINASHYLVEVSALRWENVTSTKRWLIIKSSKKIQTIRKNNTKQSRCSVENKNILFLFNEERYAQLKIYFEKWNIRRKEAARKIPGCTYSRNGWQITGWKMDEGYVILDPQPLNFIQHWSMGKIK